jgi:MFS transporter, DHA1 family, multidrug resistance protein
LALQPWQRNLAVLFGAELLAMTAFSFVDPLVPLYIRKLGGFTTTRAAFWSSMATFSMGVIMFLISPVWGLLADRIGRKIMLLRAMFGGTLVMVLLGLAGNAYLVVALRGFQGLLTGSVAASSALAATVAPRERIPFAIGMIMVAAFTGGSIGPFLGGYIADRTGYQATFFISGGLLFLGGVGVYFGINEHFEQVKARLFTLKDMLKLAFSKQMLPLLAALSLLNLAPSLVGPMISLLIADINPGGQTATIAGIAFSIIGIAAAASSFVFGRLGERYKLQTILVVCCVAAGAFYLPPVWAGSVFLLTLFLTLAGLFRGGISTSSNAIVGLSVPSGQQGIAFGLSQSASSLGGGLGSLAGGSLAEVTGIRPVFAVAAGVFVLVGVLANRWLMPHKGKHVKTPKS